jgi:hypothetical protein
MGDDERLDAGAPTKVGPIGISARLFWLAATLWGLYQIIFEWPSILAETEIFAETGILLVTVFTILLFSDVVNIVFRRNWAYRPLQVLIALAVVALVVDLIAYQEAWEAPLAWLVWVADLFVFAFLTVSFVVGIPLRLRGCELAALPALAARMRGQPFDDTSRCIVGLQKIDEWEDRRRAG